MTRRTLVPLAVSWFLVATATAAQADRRALVIGINKYEVPDVVSGAGGTAGSARTRGQHWVDLDGAVADAQAMRDLLLRRYGFKESEIHLVVDGEATRARILAEIDDYLVKGTRAGDLRFFYYAGHGSQVRNSKSSEWDKLDETIVPADVARLDRADIRDKELARRFNTILDAKGELVVILDSCHSGSAARGLPEGKHRAGPVDERDIADPAPPPRAPESRGALVLSAASDFQTAAEGSDAEHHPHGVFSLALFEVLGRTPADQPVDRIFASVRAVLQRDGHTQEPVLGASDDRKRRSLLGARSGGGDGDRTPIAVVRAGSMGDIELKGGLADGLAPGCELVKLAGNKKLDGIRVKIEKVKGMATASGLLVRGRPDEVKEGDLFVIDRWAPADVAALRVYLPPPGPDAAATLAFARALAPLRADGRRMTFVDDPSAAPVTHAIGWDGKGWLLTPAGGRPEPLATATPETIAARIGATFIPARATTLSAFAASKEARPAAAPPPADKPVVFVSLPPPPSLREAMLAAPQLKGRVLEPTETPGGATYHLIGRLGGDKLEYAWARPGWAPAGAGGPMPALSDWVPLGADAAATARTLDELGRRLGKVHAWLALPSPDTSFPYHLALRQHGGRGALLTGQPGDSVVEGESYDLVLAPEVDKVKAGFDARYVYVFSIDSDGRGTLLFPPYGRENRVPAAGAPAGAAPTELVLGAGLEIGSPFGLDTYVLLATGDKLTDPGVLEFDPVKTRQVERQRGVDDPLGDLLASVGTRGPRPRTPPNWSLERIQIRSRPRK